MENLKLYNIGRAVPDSAKKEIKAGRLKGKTDINPMWRIKVLTEMFGPCGIGWWYDITEKIILDDPETRQKAAFVDILLFYKDPATGEVSHGIPGTGGASFVSKESNGFYVSDECFKMALTDAISVSAKALGIGADVYYEKDKTKYDAQPKGGSFTPVNEANTQETKDLPQEWNYVRQTSGHISPQLFAAVQEQYDAAITAAKYLIAAVTDADSANEQSKKLKDIQHALTSERDVGVLWNRHIKSLGLIYDNVLKAYTPK